MSDYAIGWADMFGSGKVEESGSRRVKKLTSQSTGVGVPRMTPIFAKRGTPICSDLGGLAQILFVWMWMDVGLWGNGTHEFLALPSASGYLAEPSEMETFIDYTS